ncbi:MAG: cytochrome c3 family protein [Anaerolineae bacterium]|nr:cytochrome c3 family protein [Anaerolineae bacterium]
MSRGIRFAPAIYLLFLAGIALVLAGTVMLVEAADLHNSVEQAAETPSPTATDASAESQPSSDQPKPSNAYCLLCHAQPDRSWTLPSGETLSLTVDPNVLAGSVHGESNPEGALACADCHTNHLFPHTPQSAQTIRQFQLERYATCRNCHEDEYTRSQDSVHGAAIRDGRLEAATCVDCHGGHDIQTPDVPRQRISLTCGKCHGVIFDQYRNSVHGAALLEEGNADVPTCIDCHGVHNINDPTTNLFRVRSPQLCAKCHADDNLMAKYDITTNVFDSYLTDFHGTTVALFDQKDPTVATNKAVCFDCHGVHDIQKVDSSTSQVIRDNLLITCQKCHPGASSSFPDAWIGHFPPTLESTPLLFVVNTFYLVLIPVVVVGFILLIATDIFRRVRERLTKSRGEG